MTRTLRLAAALALAAVPLLMASCSEISEPDVTMTGVNLRGISADGIELDLLVEVDNPNAFGADIGGLEYTIYLDGLTVASGLQDETVAVPGNGSVEVGVPFTIEWEGMDRGLKKLLDGKEHDWRIKGRVEVGKGPIARPFSFSESGEFTAPSANDIQIDLDF